MLRRLVGRAGFTDVRIEPVLMEVAGVSARTLATGQVRGTPRATLIQNKGFDLDQVIDTVAAASPGFGKNSAAWLTLYWNMINSIC